MTSASVTPSPGIGLGDDVNIHAHAYVGRSLVTDMEPVVSVTLYGTATGQLVDLGHLVATPTAAEQLRDALTEALAALPAASSAVTP